MKVVNTDSSKQKTVYNFFWVFEWKAELVGELNNIVAWYKVKALYLPLQFIAVLQMRVMKRIVKSGIKIFFWINFRWFWSIQGMFTKKSFK